MYEAAYIEDSLASSCLRAWAEDAGIDSHRHDVDRYRPRDEPRRLAPQAVAHHADLIGLAERETFERPQPETIQSEQIGAMARAEQAPPTLEASADEAMGHDPLRMDEPEVFSVQQVPRCQVFRHEQGRQPSKTPGPASETRQDATTVSEGLKPL